MLMIGKLVTVIYYILANLPWRLICVDIGWISLTHSFKFLVDFHSWEFFYELFAHASLIVL